MVFSTCHTMIYMTRPQCHASECPGCEAKKMARRTQSRHLMTASKQSSSVRLVALVCSSQSTVVFVCTSVEVRSNLRVEVSAAGRWLWCFTLRVLSICEL